MLTLSRHHASGLLALGAISFSSALEVDAASFIDGYTIGSNLLGPTIVDNAEAPGLNTIDQRANDTGNNAGAYGWVSVYNDRWNIGDQVSITGIALPLWTPNTGTANNTSNGTFTFTFFDLTGGADPNAWNGVNNGEASFATRDVEFTIAGAGGARVPYATFDTAVEFTASSTGLAIFVNSTGSIRTRIANGPDPDDGLQFNRFNGNQTDGAGDGQGLQWTLAGSVVPEPSSLALLSLGAVAMMRRRRG